MKVTCFMAGLYTFVEQADALDNAARGDTDIASFPHGGKLSAYNVSTRIFADGQFHSGPGGEASRRRSCTDGIPADKAVTLNRIWLRAENLRSDA